ncbi:hypothetical protein Tco_0912718 [Tanacetum coccineum]
MDSKVSGGGGCEFFGGKSSKSSKNRCGEVDGVWKISSKGSMLDERGAWVDSCGELVVPRFSDTFGGKFVMIQVGDDSLDDPKLITVKQTSDGPIKMGKFRETLAEGALHIGLERNRVFADLTPEEKEQYKADICATNILFQGLPKDIYTLINHYTDAKDIWDNVKMLLEDFELTKDERES